MALHLSGAERANFLDKECGGDPALRSEVESLLSSHQKAGSEFLASPPTADFSPRLSAFCSPGSRLGAYKLVKELGRGGMGVVMLAEDTRLGRKVAIKLTAPELYFDEQANQRFQREAEVIANLNHPHIAQLLDSGATPEGLPYFVMELIEGEPIGKYCDDHRLSIADRLKLFCQVCSAVQYAHQQLIIHRDIKPSNILVTSDGSAKLLDFGIAKILHSEPAPQHLTLTKNRILTPSYASPEQIKGEPMSTVSDVYSLGVVLFELLAGCSPYGTESVTPQDIAQAACEREPERPSLTFAAQASASGDRGSGDLSNLRQGSPEKLRRVLSGDLDNIVLMALRKEPARRYASVEQFAEDIRRHLARLPVLARNDTIRYRVSRFIVRHKTGVIAAGFVTLALIAGLSATLYEAHLARQQRARAERRFNDVRKLANSMIFELHDSIRDLPGAMPARKILVNRALEYLDSLSREAGGDTSLQTELAAAYDRVGDLLGYDGAANLGDYTGALNSYNKALAIRESSATANPDDLRPQLDLLNDYFRLSFTLLDSGRSEALGIVRRAIPLAQRISQLQRDPRYKDWLAGFYWMQGNILLHEGDNEGALESYRQAAAIREPFENDEATDPVLRTHIAANYVGLSKALRATGQANQAVEAANKSTQILESLVPSDPTNGTLQEYVGESYDVLSGALKDQGNLSAALLYARKAREIFVKLNHADPSNALARDNASLMDVSIGNLVIREGRISTGMSSIRTAIANFQKLEPKSPLNMTELGWSCASMAHAYVVLANLQSVKSVRVTQLRQAKSWFYKSLSAWPQQVGLTASLLIGSDIVPTREEAARELADCDRELATLKSAGY